MKQNNVNTEYSADFAITVQELVPKLGHEKATLVAMAKMFSKIDVKLTTNRTMFFVDGTSCTQTESGLTLNERVNPESIALAKELIKTREEYLINSNKNKS